MPIIKLVAVPCRGVMGDRRSDVVGNIRSHICNVEKG